MGNFKVELKFEGEQEQYAFVTGRTAAEQLAAAQVAMQILIQQQARQQQSNQISAMFAEPAHQLALPAAVHPPQPAPTPPPAQPAIAPVQPAIVSAPPTYPSHVPPTDIVPMVFPEQVGRSPVQAATRLKQWIYCHPGWVIALLLGASALGAYRNPQVFQAFSQKAQQLQAAINLPMSESASQSLPVPSPAPEAASEPVPETVPVPSPSPDATPTPAPVAASAAPAVKDPNRQTLQEKLTQILSEPAVSP